MRQDYQEWDINIDKVIKLDNYSKAIDLVKAMQIMRYALIFPDDKTKTEAEMELFLTKYIKQNDRPN